MNRILITGTSRGLGKNLLEEFFLNGDEVISLGRTPCERNVPHVFCDFSRPDKLKDLFCLNELLKKHFDIVVMNAGTLGSILQAKEVTNDSLLETFHINFFSNKIIIDECLKNSNKSQKFIYVSSGASKKGYTGWLEYCSSKSATDSLIRVYAKENPKHLFISISPGAIDTNMQKIIRNSDYEQFPDMKKFFDLKSLNKLRKAKDASKSLKNFISTINKDMNGKFFEI